jgi:glucose/arabinose dehydrogenase
LVAQGLDYPTSMAFLGQNDILVLENQKSTVQRIVNGDMLARPLLTVSVSKDVDKCMCGIAIDNYNSSSKYVFLYYTEADGKKPPGDRLYRYQWINDSLLSPKLLIDIPATANHSQRHAGGAILIDPKNKSTLYLATGDDNGHHGTLAQNVINGKPVDGTGGILRMTVDGKPTQPNGILGNSYPLNLYYAYGIRNSYGLDIDPLTGSLWDTENGPDYGDEINLVAPGFNSGSDKIYGFAPRGYSVDNLVNFGGKGKYSDPEFEWGNSLGPTAIKFLRSDKLGTNYQNDMFVADVIYGRIYHFDLNDARTELILKGPLADKRSDTDREGELQDIIFVTIPGGVTDLKISPYDGYLYLVAYGQGKIFRIVPSS